MKKRVSQDYSIFGALDPGAPDPKNLEHGTESTSEGRRHAALALYIPGRVRGRNMLGPRDEGPGSHWQDLARWDAEGVYWVGGVTKGLKRYNASNLNISEACRHRGAWQLSWTAHI